MPASIAKRLNAATLDGTLFAAASLGAAFLLETGWALAGLFLMVVFFEPLCIRLAGQTPGQAVVGIRVVARRGKLGFLRLWARWWLKVVLSPVSVFYVWFSEKSASLHDLASGTAVLDPQREPAPLSDQDFRLPAAWRRYIVALLWYPPTVVVAATLVFAPIAAVKPSLLDPSSEPFGPMNLLFYVIDATVLVFVLKWGSEGRLLGARRLRQSDSH